MTDQQAVYERMMHIDNSHADKRVNPDPLLSDPWRQYSTTEWERIADDSLYGKR